MSALNEKLLRRFVKLAADRLAGDWVLLGGTVLPMLGRDYRSTTDIDFVPVGKAGTDQSLKLMEICEELKLPVETVNAAARHFLGKVEGFEKHLVLLQEGRNAKVYRPDIALYLELKLGRLSESDLSDCLEILKLLGRELKAPERKSLLRQVAKSLQAARAQDSGREKRLQRLELALASGARAGAPE